MIRSQWPIPSNQAFAGITTGKGYAIDDTATKKQIVVDMYFIAGIGKRTETYPFIAASTGRFTQVGSGFSIHHPLLELTRGDRRNSRTTSVSCKIAASHFPSSRP